MFFFPKSLPSTKKSCTKLNNLKHPPGHCDPYVGGHFEIEMKVCRLQYLILRRSIETQ